MPLLLGSLGLTTTAIGAIMAIDNVFALTVQPLVGIVCASMLMVGLYFVRDLTLLM